MSDRKDIEDLYPLSPMQQGMLFHTLYATQPKAYCVQWYCIFHGYLHVWALQQAWQSVMDRHTILRTAINWELRHEPFQIVYRHAHLPWQQYDWRHLSVAAQEQQLEAFLHADRAQGFPLAKAPLMRLHLIQLTENSYHLIWSVSHLLLDGWSLRLLLQEVSQLHNAFCAGQEAHLPMCRPYGDYIGWLQQQDLSQAEAFWRPMLKGFTTPTVVDGRPEPHHSGSIETGYAAQQRHLSRATTTALQRFAHDHHLSVNTLIQGAWAILLSRYSGQDDVLFGATVASRPPDMDGIESMIGLFINTLPIRVQVTPETQLLPWLQLLQSQQVEARQYDYSPLVQVHGWSDVPRDVPFFESLLVFENYPTRTTRQDWGRNLDIRQTRLLSHTHYPLTMVAFPDAELGLRLEYHCDRFNTGTIVRMLGHLHTLLEGMIAHSPQRLTDLPMLTAAERQQLLSTWNDTSTVYPQGLCLQQWFEAQVTRVPEAVAVLCADTQLTYRELNAQANQLAHYLSLVGVGLETLVGIYMERSVEMLIGLLGVLKAGGAYVPLDPAYPAERLAMMLADTQVPVVLTQKRFLGGLPGYHGKVVCLDTDWEMIAQQPQTNLPCHTRPEHVAYVLYTSGSTGTPNGVMIEHRSLVHYLWWVNTYVLRDTLQLPTVTSLSFDACLKQLFAPLLRGATVWLLPSDIFTQPVALLQALHTRSHVGLNCVPSLWAILLDTMESDTTLRLTESFTDLLLGGEQCSQDLVERSRALLPHITIWNCYGPTEATANACVGQIAPQSVVTIGRPLANTHIYILDANGQPVPIGVAGELHIGGVGLARGYLHRPELTRQRFIPDPFSDQPEARLYKTGDLARYLPDGNIEFLGRLDHQIKIRGYRVEPEEIEATLELHAAIQQALVLAQQDHASATRLVAYCVPHQGSVPDLREVHQFLLTKLPAYMVPTDFVVLEALPLTANGKVDRQALPAPPELRSSVLTTFVAARTPVEELVVDIWTQVLAIDSVGIHDNFFALGGHSLLAMQVMSRLRKVFRVDVPLQALFDAPTVADLARHVTRTLQTSQITTTLPCKAVPQQETAPLTITQEHLWDLDRLLPGAPFSNMPYVVRLLGPLDIAAFEQSWHAIIARHDILRTTFTIIDEEPVQVSAPVLHLPLLLEDLRTLPAAERDVQTQQWIRREALYFFDLEHGPLLRIRLLWLDVQEYILLLTMHHIISDGWSLGVFLQELTVLYEAFRQNRPSPLRALPLQYADYAQWQHQWLHSEAGQAQLAYWMQQLQEPLPVVALPTDRPPPTVMDLRAAHQSFHFTNAFTAALTRLSRQEGVTVFMTLVAAFKTLLYSYSGQQDIRVGTLVANRQHQDTEGLVGLFANLTVLRTNLGGNPSMRQVLQRVRTTTLDAYAHQDLPFDYLARALVETYECDRQTLFPAMFAMQNARQHTLTLADLTTQVLETQPIQVSACDLAVSVRESTQGLDGLCVYKTALFDAATITRMLADYRTILESFLTQRELRLSFWRVQRDR